MLLPWPASNVPLDAVLVRSECGLMGMRGGSMVGGSVIGGIVIGGSMLGRSNLDYSHAESKGRFDR